MNNNMPVNPNGGGNNNPSGPAIDRINEQMMSGQSSVGQGPSLMQGTNNVNQQGGIMQGMSNQPAMKPTMQNQNAPQNIMPGQGHSGINSFTMQKETPSDDIISIPGANPSENNQAPVNNIPNFNNPGQMQGSIPNQNNQINIPNEIKMPEVSSIPNGNNNIPNPAGPQNDPINPGIQPMNVETQNSRIQNDNTMPQNQMPQNMANQNNQINIPNEIKMPEANSIPNGNNNMPTPPGPQNPQANQDMPKVNPGVQNNQTNIQNEIKIPESNNNNQNPVGPQNPARPQSPQTNPGMPNTNGLSENKTRNNQNINETPNNIPTEQPKSQIIGMPEDKPQKPEPTPFDKPENVIGNTRDLNDAVTGINPTKPKNGVSQVSQTAINSGVQNNAPYQGPKNKKIPLSTREMVLIGIALVGIIVVIILYA